MIDFVKANISRDFFNQNNNLDFFKPCNTDTGEVKEKGIADHKNLLIKRKQAYVVLQGSLHKYYNEGEHNYSDFGYDMLCETIDTLADEINITPRLCPLLNLEFGINIPLDISPTALMQKNIVLFKGNRPTFSGQVKGVGYMIQFEYSNYIIKMYDKGAQYSQPDNILRFEVKTKKMQYIQKTRIGNLADLKDRSRLLILREILIDLFDKIQIIDPVKDYGLSPAEKDLLVYGLNSKQHKSSIPDLSKVSGQSTKTLLKNHYRKLKDFKELVSNETMDNQKQEIRKKIITKSLILLTEAQSNELVNSIELTL